MLFKSDGKLGFHGGYTDYGSYGIGWALLEIETDVDNELYRVNYNGGGWTAWMNAPDAGGLTSGRVQSMFIYDDPGNELEFDYVEISFVP